LDLLTQVQGLPADFRDHFFDVPLVVRVDLNGAYLADAMLMLGRDQTVQLIKYTETDQSTANEDERDLWLKALANPRPLGRCIAQCPDGLLALDYSLARSQLSILTEGAERGQAGPRYYSLPGEGSGLLLHNQVNVAGSESQMYGTYVASALGSRGPFTAVAEAQLDRSTGEGVSIDRHRVRSLYTDYLHEGSFYRLGYFTPSLQGLSRQPRTLNGLPEGTLGIMFGSSDSLDTDDAQPSATPIYVTPNRPATVEVYRNGSLINSQPVQPGLQAIDTRPLPGGVYPVEIRLVEDGQVTVTSEEFVYKPNNWSNPEQRWRYNAYLGQGKELFSNWQNNRDEGMNAGIIANYLFHPTAILGLSVERLDSAMQYGGSLDWDITPQLRTFTNVYRTEGRGNGLDLQAIYTYDSGSVVASHTRSWLYRYQLDDRLPAFLTPRYHSELQESSQTSLSWQHRFTPRGSGVARFSQNTGAISGMGLDLSWIQRAVLMGSDTTWRFSVFDRPALASSGAQRNRGVDVSLTLSLGAQGSSLYGSLGSRTRRDGGREQTASFNYQHTLQGPFLRSVTGTLNHDSYGLGVGGRLAFQNRLLAGDGYLQTSSYNDELGGGLNLSNTLALGGGHIASTGDMAAYQAGMVVDVDSDVSDIELRSYDGHGSSGRLHPGRNIIPLSPYKKGKVRFDIGPDQDGQPVVVAPQVADYHVNRGGVAFQRVHVMRTLTVIGRLLSPDGQPVAGALVINHASRSVTEADGFFAVEMSQSTPTLEVRVGNQRHCLVTIDTEKGQQDQDVVLMGDLTCSPRTLASAAAKEVGDA
jgi:outer membrane usher protein FimD/PapC